MVIVNKMGSIRIPDAIVATIAGYAATNCFGIKGMTACSIHDGIVRLLGSDNMHRGVKLKVNGDHADIDLHVATVHFLDGMEPQTYAEQLFRKWQLSEEDVLLLCAAGEDSFAVFMGDEAERVIGRSNAENLLYTSSEFGQLFRKQQYDAAIAAFCNGFNHLLEKQTGDSVRMNGLFGQQALSVPEKLDAYGGELWRDVMDAINETTSDYQEHHRREEREENGLTAGGWIVLIILILIMFRRNRFDRAHRYGCGCSPLGWILGLLGLGFLFKKD